MIDWLVASENDEVFVVRVPNSSAVAALALLEVDRENSCDRVRRDGHCGENRGLAHGDEFLSWLRKASGSTPGLSRRRTLEFRTRRGTPIHRPGDLAEERTSTDGRTGASHR